MCGMPMPQRGLRTRIPPDVSACTPLIRYRSSSFGHSTSAPVDRMIIRPEVTARYLSRRFAIVGRNRLT